MNCCSPQPTPPQIAVDQHVAHASPCRSAAPRVMHRVDRAVVDLGGQRRPQRRGIGPGVLPCLPSARPCRPSCRVAFRPGHRAGRQHRHDAAWCHTSAELSLRPVNGPTMKAMATGISRMPSISSRFENGVGFSSATVLLGPYQPPPLLPSCLIATIGATGPSGIFCSLHPPKPSSGVGERTCREGRRARPARSAARSTAGRAAA
jgi:hypothetical protein